MLFLSFIPTLRSHCRCTCLFQAAGVELFNPIFPSFKMKHIVKNLLFCSWFEDSCSGVESIIRCCFIAASRSSRSAVSKSEESGYNDSIARGASDQSGLRSVDVDVWARALSRFEYTTAEYQSSSRKKLSCSEATLALWIPFNLQAFFFFFTDCCFYLASNHRNCWKSAQEHQKTSRAANRISTNIKQLSHKNTICSKFVQH